ELLEKAAAADTSGELQLDMSIAVFRTAGSEAGLRQIDRVAESRRDANYYYARAQMLDASGKSGDAIAAMKRAIQVSPKRADLYWQLAVFLTRNAGGPEARQLLDRAEQLLPQDPQIPLVRATLLEVEGKSEEAESLLGDIQR